jgi:hypothetical protein
LKTKFEQYLDEDQFGFRKGRGTREAILAFKQILERRLEVNIDTYAIFTDIEKAFNKVDWKLLFKTLREKEIDWKDRRFIFNLYKDQTTEIEVNGLTEETKIRQGVRQGCPLSPYLFNLYIEASINKMKDKTAGVQINGRNLHCIHFADDIVILSETVNEMNDMLRVLATTLYEYKLKINTHKTKTMLMSKSNINQINGNIKLNYIT